MYKKRFLLFFVVGFLFVFGFCLKPVYATETTEVFEINPSIDTQEENTGWVKISCNVPEGFPGTLKVVLYETTVQEELIYFLREDNDYKMLAPLPYGTYKVAAVFVSGGADGCFEIGYPTDELILDKNNTVPVEVPVYIGIAQEMQDTGNNEFAGMTYEEVMAAVKEKSEDSNTNEDIVDESSGQKEPVIDADTEEEYFEKVKEYVANQETQQEQEAKHEEYVNKNKKDSVWGLISMSVVLVGLGVGFYFFKKKRDL